MNYIRTTLPIALIIGLAGCGASAHEAGITADTEAPALTETFRLKKDKFSTTIQIPGELIAYQQVDIYAKVTSFVKELKVCLLYTSRCV